MKRPAASSLKPHSLEKLTPSAVSSSSGSSQPCQITEGAFDPEVDCTPEINEGQMVDDLATWMNSHEGRLPQRKSKEALKDGNDETKMEHSLALFIKRQRSALASGEFADKIKAPLPVKTHSGTWENSRTKLVAWLNNKKQIEGTGASKDASGWVYPHQKSNDPEEKKLASWINQQRKCYKNNTLTDDRERLLYQLPGWRWTDHEPAFMSMLERLKKWVASGKLIEALVDAENTRGDANALAKWIASLRDGYRRRNNRRLSAVLKQMCEDADTKDAFMSVWPPEEDLSWDEHFKVLQWWGDQCDGLPYGENPNPSDCRYDVLHPEHGWVCLGHFYTWSMHAIEDDVNGKPAEGRHGHRYFPTVLDARQKKMIEDWVDGRRGMPREKKRKTRVRLLQGAGNGADAGSVPGGDG